MNKETPKKVATFASSLIGDTLLATALYRILRGHYPAAEFTLLSEVREHPVLDGFNTFDRVIQYSSDLNLPDLFDLVVLPVFCGDARVNEHLNSFANVLTLDKLHAPQRGLWRNKWSGEFDHLLFYKHQVELNADLARHLGWSGEMPPLYCPQGDAAKFARFRNRIGLFINTPQNTFQALPNRQWPLANWKQLVEMLRNENVVLVGGFSDSPNLKEIARQTGCDYEATASIADFTALCRNLKALVTTDGGGMHVAATTGVPIVSLHGTSSPILLHPWMYPNGKCIAILAPNTCSPCQRSLRLHLCEQGTTRMACMERIQPEAVTRVLDDLDQLSAGTCLILKGDDLLTKEEYIRSWKRKILATGNFNFARAALRLHAPSKSRLESSSRPADIPSAASN